MEPNRVVQALKVLHDEGREDLIREGVLEQAWVGIKRPKRLSAEGVSAAVAACTSPVKQGKKFKAKSVSGRKVVRSPQRVDEPFSAVPVSYSGVAGKRQGGCRFPRRQGMSLSRRVAAGGRGAATVGAVRTYERMGARAVFAHARSARKPRKALLSVETGGERASTSLEERALGGAHKMAAPLVSDWSDDQVLEESQSGTVDKMAAPFVIEDAEVVIISDEEEGELRGPEGVGDKVLDVFIGAGAKGVGRMSQGSSKLFSPRSGKVQSGHLDKLTVFRSDEQVEFLDGSGRVLSGRVFGETFGSSAGDRAIVQIDVSQAIWSEGPSGCDALPASGGQGVKAVYRPSGRMVGDLSTPVKVRAPSAHWPEGRARSGAVRLTSRDAFSARDAQPSTSQGAGDGWEEWYDDLLDYDEELDFQVSSKQSERSQKETPGAVQGGQVPERSHVLASGFPRGEQGLGVFGVTQGGICGRGVSGDSRVSYLQGEKDISHKVDAAVQANVVMEVDHTTTIDWWPVGCGKDWHVTAPTLLFRKLTSDGTNVDTLSVKYYAGKSRLSVEWLQATVSEAPADTTEQSLMDRYRCSLLGKKKQTCTEFLGVKMLDDHLRKFKVKFYKGLDQKENPLIKKLTDSSANPFDG
ncbi:hypothetical protein NDU88_007329 [Pleurodeles waltl]|uniref:Uncharacterized protein n=1 Tax=Pleurodeles waltl TaxID=8319 RepID=A0AAV7VU26_PLEWA|nr:hypothetical protein NDU88_007329 [Pleurodeles waltl]